MIKHFLILIVAVISISCTEQTEINVSGDFNFDWKFSLEADEAAIQTSYDDQNWRTVQLPHDWSIEFPFDTINGEGCVGYLPGGTGWYRKHFHAPTDKQVTVLFDGVYNNSEVWINGEKLGNHPYGYSPFHFDLTPFLNTNDQENILVVKVDRTRFADSRWYTGSGIYRNVELLIKDKLHVPVWGTFITTPVVSKEKATVAMETAIVNSYNEDKTFRWITLIQYPDGKTEVEVNQDKTIEAGKKAVFNLTIPVKNPVLWDIDDPKLYTALTRLELDGKVVEEYKTTFGIRTFDFDPDKGFFLNGVNRKIKGVCLHHDGGLVGAAVPKEVWRRRLQTLKDGGCNAIRISHNPASDEFLDLCDEMGFLVQDEFFDEWDYPKDKRLNMNQRISTDYITKSYTEHFQEWAERDLKTTMLSHRNHPSIFQWSIGNEIEWTYPRNKQSTGFWDADWSGNYFWNETPLTPQEIKERYDNLPAMEYNIGETAQKLSRWTKELDTSRPVVANCILPSASYASGYADALDVIGFSYRRVMYDYGHKHFPNLPIMGTENVAQYHEWKAIEERPYISGTFLWTGIDYMGEAHHREGSKAQRRKGTHSGLLDYAGFPKPSYYHMKTMWSETPTLEFTTQTLKKSPYKMAGENIVEKKPGSWERRLWYWHAVNKHWNYEANEQVLVEVISNCTELELFLNGKSLGKKYLKDFEDYLYKWMVPFAEGELTAKGIVDGKEVSKTLKTAGKAEKIALTADKTELKADGYDIAHIVIQLQDKNGNPVYNDEQKVMIEVSGDVEYLGVDNGYTHSLQTYRSNEITTHEGKALLVVKSTKKSGSATIKTTINNNSSTVQLNIN